MEPWVLFDSGAKSRRGFLKDLAVVAGALVVLRKSDAVQTTDKTRASPYAASVLPSAIRSRFIENVNGGRFHILEAGFEPGNRPLVLLLHGFPELAYSWRKVMPDLASAGFHLVAPDLRGYGRSCGWDVRYDDDLAGFRTLNQVTDMLALVSALGYRSTAAAVGHDFGSPLAAWCALVRPDVFHSVVMMSAPFSGSPSLPFDTADHSDAVHDPDVPDPVFQALAVLVPPRKHYQQYYATREANSDMWHAPQGVHDFLRAYYHMKSADWKQNHPFPLKSWTAGELAKLPRYYVMDLNRGMAETVAPEMPSPAEIAACKWLPESELRVYSAEYGRTGFQGGLEGYRVAMDPVNAAELRLFSGKTIDVPAMFVAGKSDWGTYQRPGALENMRQRACTHFRGVHLVEGAGHWVQQEQSAEVTRLLLDFLNARMTEPSSVDSGSVFQKRLRARPERG